MKKISCMVIRLLLFLLLAVPQLHAQRTSAPGRQYQWLAPRDSQLLKVSLLSQFWTTYSTGTATYNQQTGNYEPVDDRLNMSFRRARLVFSGAPYARITYNLALHYDLTGHDILAGTLGSTNRDQPNVGIWDAFGQYRISAKTQLLTLTAGYFRPQLQRESITTAWAPSSFEKSMSQNYVRRHLVGTGPGRSTGLNLGGLWLGSGVGLLYNVGIFTPVAIGLEGSSGGRQFAPLLAGRLSLQIGQPEMSTYGISYQQNYYSERKGLSLDLNISRQGQTDNFLASYAYGPGCLFNFGPLNADAEWLWLVRRGSEATGVAFDSRSATGHVRLSYNLRAGRYLLEPSFMLMAFRGAMDAEEQRQAGLVGASAGREVTRDAGLNLHFNKRKLRLYLHYVWRAGEAGAAGDGARVNQYFFQPGVGAIYRGNYWGLGCNLII
jgi:hypothetical protein